MNLLFFRDFRCAGLLALSLSGFLGAQTAAAQTVDTSTRYALLGPAVTYHQQRTHAGRPYNEQNWAVGLERRDAVSNDGRWERSFGAAALQDSFDKPSVLSSVSLQRRLAEGAGLEVLAGAQVGLAYKHMDWDRGARWVPYAGPSFSLRSTGTGLGLNGLYVYKRNATTGRVSGIFLLQSSWTY